MVKRMFFSWLLVVVVVSSVGAQKKKEGVSTPISVNYCLPKVNFRVIVTLECTRLIPGPYWKYAEKELGIKPDIQMLKEEWNIEDIEIKSQYIPDTKAVYSISASGDYHPIMVNLSAEGFLIGVFGGEAAVFSEEKKMRYHKDGQTGENVIDIMNINTYNHMKEVLDTNYTYQEMDKVMKKIWDPIVRYVAKTEQDNVKEAVSEIFRIRSERVKLLGGDNSVPDGLSLEIILKEFNRMESNYLSLFIGKQERQTIVRTFECEPEKAGEPIVAFRFTEDGGVVGKKNVSGIAYFLQVQNVVIPASAVAPEGVGVSAAAIYYRVPAVADLKLMKANEELMSFRTIVPQLGEIRKIPTDVIINEGLSLKFYPQFGSLKSVDKK